jgi:hypothetical protein
VWGDEVSLALLYIRLNTTNFNTPETYSLEKRAKGLVERLDWRANTLELAIR